MERINGKDCTVTWDDSARARTMVFEHVIKWFHSHGKYTKDGVLQCDEPVMTAPECMAELAELIGFEVDYG